MSGPLQFGVHQLEYHTVEENDWQNVLGDEGGEGEDIPVIEVLSHLLKFPSCLH